MTKENSLKHFDFLGGALARAEIIDPVTGKITDPRRVLNSDECPNPFGGTGHRDKVVAAVGEPCKKLVSQLGSTHLWMFLWVWMGICMTLI